MRRGRPIRRSTVLATIVTAFSSATPAPAAAAEDRPTATRAAEDVIRELADDPKSRARLKQQQAQVLLEQAQRAHRAGRYEEAWTLAQKAARLDARLAAAKDLAARLADHAPAEPQPVSPHIVGVHLYAGLARARASFDAGDLDAALDWYRAVIRGASRLPHGP